MYVIIAGGSGLIGAALTGELLQAGHQVGILTRRPGQARLPAGAEALGWDGRSARGWEDSLARAGALINLAGENIGASPWTSERKRQIRASRVDTGLALVEAVRQSAARPQVLLQSSAVGYYGPHGSQPLDESAPPGSDFLSGVAVDWENASRAVEELGVRRVIFRTGVVLAKEGGILDRFLYPVKLFAGGPMGSGQQWIPWIHMRDEVRAIRFLLESQAAAGVYNLTAPQPVTNAEFVRTLAGVLGRPYWLPVPAFALKLLLGEMSTLVLDGQKALPARLLAEGFSFDFAELRPALSDLLK